MTNSPNDPNRFTEFESELRQFQPRAYQPSESPSPANRSVYIAAPRQRLRLAFPVAASFVVGIGLGISCTLLTLSMDSNVIPEQRLAQSPADKAAEDAAVTKPQNALVPPNPLASPSISSDFGPDTDPVNHLQGPRVAIFSDWQSWFSRNWATEITRPDSNLDHYTSLNLSGTSKDVPRDVLQLAEFAPHVAEQLHNSETFLDDPVPLGRRDVLQVLEDMNSIY